MGIYDYTDNLIKNVIILSTNKTWEKAVQEWEIVDCEIDDSLSESCVCGKEHLKYLFTIRNINNGNELFPIGSTCINKFERDDLNAEISVYEDMFQLVRAVKNKEHIELNAKYFSRKLLGYLYCNNVFKPNIYNDFEPENDYRFLLEMYNKRNKDEISDAKQRKINAIIATSILPFVHDKIKEKSNANEQFCPKCGSQLVIRIARAGQNPGSKFWGCMNFPNCRFTKSIE